MLPAIAKDDMQLQKEVLNELVWDSRVDASEVCVVVEEGVVTLTGTVSSYIQKVAAGAAAHRVWGVRDVADDLKVVLPGTITVSDAEIAHAVRTALRLDVMVPQDRIESTVSDGWVTLEGQVDLWRHFEDAERAVRHLTGVVGVSNKIKVAPSPISTDQVHTAIEQAIERQAERTAHHIRVAVRNGEVTIAGKVRSLREKEAVLDAAGHAPGVVQVDDQLVVDPLA